MRELESTGILADPDGGLPAYTTLVLGLCGKTMQAEALLQRALAAKEPDPAMTSLWGLAAVVLGKENIAATLLEKAARQRCGLAPFVQHMPIVRRHADSPALEQFQAAMAKQFRCAF